MASLSGGLFLFVRKDYRVRVSLDQIEKIKQELTENQRKFYSFDADYPLGLLSNPSLLDPKTILPKTSSYNLNQLRDLNEYSNSCDQSLIKNNIGTFKKSWIWQQYICGHRKFLPKDFFKKAPFFHPFGGSFAYGAYQSGKEPFIKPLWLVENFKYFHILEWKNLSKDMKIVSGLSKMIKVLMSFDLNSASDFHQRKNLIISTQFVLLKNDIKTDQSSYTVYYKIQFQKILKKNHLSLKRYSPQFSCTFRDGNYCWEKDTDTSFKQFNILTLSLLLLILLVLLLSIRALLKKIKSREDDRERKDFILKAISHEIRSPITAMRLIIDNIKKEFDDLPDKFQYPFLEISTQVGQLNTVVEKSKQYLNTNNEAPLELELKNLDSIKDFLESVTDPYLEKGLICHIKTHDSLISDPYWLSVAIRNIIENAFKHGKPPVKLESYKRDKKLFIEIEDAGTDKLHKKIFSAFQKKTSSEGLGLGLFLTQKIVHSLKGKIEIKTDPTRFVLIFK